MGVAERAQPLAALHSHRVPPHRERAQGGCPWFRGPGASGRPAGALHHRPAVHAPVSPGHRSVDSLPSPPHHHHHHHNTTFHGGMLKCPPASLKREHRTAEGQSADPTPSPQKGQSSKVLLKTWVPIQPLILGVGLLASYITSLSLSFLVCKMDGSMSLTAV